MVECSAVQCLPSTICLMSTVIKIFNLSPSFPGFESPRRKWLNPIDCHNQCGDLIGQTNPLKRSQSYTLQPFSFDGQPKSGASSLPEKTCSLSLDRGPPLDNEHHPGSTKKRAKRTCTALDREGAFRDWWRLIIETWDLRPSKQSLRIEAMAQWSILTDWLVAESLRRRPKTAWQYHPFMNCTLTATYAVLCNRTTSHFLFPFFLAHLCFSNSRTHLWPAFDPLGRYWNWRGCR